MKSESWWEKSIVLSSAYKMSFHSESNLHWTHRFCCTSGKFEMCHLKLIINVIQKHRILFLIYQTYYFLLSSLLCTHQCIILQNNISSSSFKYYYNLCYCFHKLMFSCTHLYENFTQYFVQNQYRIWFGWSSVQSEHRHRICIQVCTGSPMDSMLKTETITGRMIVKWNFHT